MGAARKYPDELRDRAIRLVLDVVKDQDASVTAACRKVGGELGIKPDTLRGWAKQAQIDRGMRPGTTSADAARIRALERENAELRRVNAILRTASAFFAAELDHGSPPVALVVAFIEACRDQFGVEPMCRALRQAGVAISPSGYYAARARALLGESGRMMPRWRSRFCGSIRTAGNGTARGRCGTSSTARASRRPGAPWSG